MAQAKVSDFFGTKKRSLEAHPSKRRKIESSDSDLKAGVVGSAAVESSKSNEVTLPVGKHHSSRSVTRRTRSTAHTKRSAKKKHPLTSQATIHEAFAKSSGSSSDTDGQDKLQDVGSSEVTEDVTSYWDEHDGTKTPKRKTRPSDSIEVPLSDCRGNKTVRRRKQPTRDSDNATPKKDDLSEEEKAARGRSLAWSFRNSLAAAQSASTNSNNTQVSEDKEIVSIIKPKDSNQEICSTNNSQPHDTEEHVAMPSDEDLSRVLKSEHPVPISPLPPTPQGVSCKSSKTAVTVSPVVKASMEKLKELQKEDGGVGKKKAEDKLPARTKTGEMQSKKVIAPGVMRERLAKCGKLDTLKAKLAEMNSSLKAVRNREAEKRKAKTDEDEADVVQAEPVKSTTQAEPKPAPAYERYEHLAREGPPSLALPGKYQRLLTTFQGTDTVVSMLFNRQEVITFSKLQTAVQSMTRKNFEQKQLGQIKTVYPDAYILRQEKGLPGFGNKVSGYQLTVEPNMDGLGETDARADKSERQTMTAQVLLKRKRVFHNSLVNITKDHHANFLSKQKPPIEVSPSLLTRWHPRFPLDSVPDIKTAELPAPPLQKAQTAKQVLDSAKGKLPARVEAAMAKVAMKSESPQPKASPSGEASKSSSASKPDSAYKGIPLSLLEKIRAKEAAKTQAALTRDPKEDKKTEMIGRLPTLIRSLRTFYVTEKKPSLPYRTVVDKLVDSYQTFISSVEVEAHLTLLQELAPKWIQVIEITRGKYVKIDKNMDISVIIAELNNLAKSRQ